MQYLFQASYFCFVTISTIGFGDFVPSSSNFKSSADSYTMILSAMYMILGMATLSMCFSLMQVYTGLGESEGGETVR